MTTAFPAALDSFTNPSGANNQVDSVGGRVHSAMHADINDAMEAVQAALGTDLSLVVPVAGTRTGAQVVLQAGNAAHVPLIAKGTTAQSGNLQEWQNSSGSVLAKIYSGGDAQFANLYTNGIGDVATGAGPYVSMLATSVLITNRTTTSNVPLVIIGMAAQSGNLQEWQNSSGTTLASVAAAGEGTFSSIRSPEWQSGSLAGAYMLAGATGVGVFNRTDASYTPFFIRGMAAQSGDLQQWQDSAGNPLAGLSATGRLLSNGVNVSSSAGRFEFGHADQAQTTVGAAGGASALPATPTKYFKVKDSDGTEYVIPAYAAA